MALGLDVSRPSGLLPRASVERRTVLHYQPGWLLLALPLLALLVARRRSGAAARAAAPASHGPTDDQVARIRESAAEVPIGTLP